MLRNIIYFFKLMTNKFDIETHHISKKIMPDSDNIRELEKQKKEFKLRAIKLIENICGCKVHDLHLDGISNDKADPCRLSDEISGELILYYHTGACRYYDLHAFNDYHDVIIAIYRD
jgi:hypothetical protein